MTAAALELPALCTVDEAAQAMSLHPDQIRRLVRAGELVGYRLGRRASSRVGLSPKRLAARALRENAGAGRKKIAGGLTARIIGRIKGESAAHRAQPTKGLPP